MTKTFYRVYRPQKFDELLGQDLIRLTLKQAIKENRIAHAFLFTGPRGTGKTTTARIFAKAVNCLTPLDKRDGAEPCDECKNCLAIMGNKTLDLMEIDAASYTGVDNIRQLTENIDLSPADLKYRIFIIDEVHMLSRGAFNALLKTLEEPPAHTIFILATTEQHKVPLTIASRCQRFSFRLLALPEILKKLSLIAKKEKINIDQESLEMISEAASGGMRDAESLLAQVASLAGKEIKSNETRDILGIAGRDDEVKLLASLLDKNISQTADRFEQMNNDGMDMFLLSHRLLDYLRKMIFIKLNPRGAAVIEQEISESQVETLKSLAAKISVTDLLSLTAKIVQSQPTIKNSSFPHLPLELAVVEWGLKDNDSLFEEFDRKVKNDPKLSPESSSCPSFGNPEIAIPSKEESTEKKHLGKPEKKEFKIKKSNKKVENDPPSADLKTVLAKWTTVLQNVRQLQPALFSLLKVCSPVRIEDDVLIISTPFKFHKDKLNDGKNRAVFCQELKKEVGISRICVVQDNSLPNNKVNDDEMLDQVKSLLAS
jgi:DNA polymerase III subunit gamma/tau